MEVSPGQLLVGRRHHHRVPLLWDAVPARLWWVGGGGGGGSERPFGDVCRLWAAVIHVDRRALFGQKKLGGIVFLVLTHKWTTWLSPASCQTRGCGPPHNKLKKSIMDLSCKTAERSFHSPRVLYG